MPRRRRALEPVLVEEGSERRLAERAFPKDAEERGHRLFLLAGEEREPRRAFGCRPVAGLGSRAKAEIDAPAAGGGGKLVMRHLVQQHIGFGVDAQRAAVPAYPAPRRSGPETEAEPARQTQSGAMMGFRRASARPRRLPRLNQSLKNAPRLVMREGGAKACQRPP